MADYDLFNGDADGICALVQLRLAEPRDAQLITGVKRDIDLLRQLDAVAGDRITVLDVSLDTNREDLLRVLAAGAEVFYVDHHFTGPVPSSSGLKSLLNEASDVCTSLLINHYLRGAYTQWALVGTFGDNLAKTARGLAKNLALSADQLTLLESLGRYMNYNGYGADVSELYFHPAALYRAARDYESPLHFIVDASETFEQLKAGYHDDLTAAQATEPLHSTDKIALILLPNAPWARRVSGVYSNYLTNQNPHRAHAVLTEKSDGHYLVSVRAPLNNKQGAAALCRQFATGGGREAAAGINNLPAGRLNDFIHAFKKAYP